MSRENHAAQTVFLALALVVPGALLGAVLFFFGLFPLSWLVGVLRLHPPADAKVAVVLLGLVTGAISLPVLFVRRRLRRPV